MLATAPSPTLNPLKNWQVNRADIQYLGHDLQRPECVLAERDGTVWTADARGGMMRLDPDGTQQLVTPFVENPTPPAGGNSFETRYVQSVGSLPNGVCFAENGDFVIANWGTDAIETMTREGHLRTLYTAIDGQPLGKANFPLRDSKGRIYFTVTTREQPWTGQLNTKTADGYIGLIDENGIRIVAEGFCGTNEIRFDPREEWLYVVESTGWKISRLRVQPDGSLTDREVYGPASLGGFPDGFAFDTFGNLWITLIFTDELIALTPDGEILTLLDDSNPATKKRLFDHFHAGTLTPEIMGATHGTVAPWLSSLTFGGPDMRTVYLGSLRGTRVPYFRSPVAGQPMIHW
ncbi:SMP-30/gluconolactonase/LRE family protein [Hymenobacter caeli]|uniref:Sugar lactone lactonase YvrE n=1 Tax=Hymenobacter caeli TaxID=2735894 RepID=A0ABX2FWN1_9BACT|nr:SMP-30/gluconolactonase/LRE family protein [Hymenobacter caeli]NRT20814.1 sugar lactone lactonase YvrE [Hymenobacter caeli]